MSGMSSVGGRGVYEAGDQRNVKDSEVKHADRYKEGQPNSHVAIDSSTQTYAGMSAQSRTNSPERRRQGTQIAAGRHLLTPLCLQREKEPEPISQEARDSQADPTLPVSVSTAVFVRDPNQRGVLQAKKHGNEPSKGAKIDAEIQQEEEEMLKKKGIK
ncbi:MAG: hypothetical protein Q9173_005255 [Seirophora scorigena]